MSKALVIVESPAKAKTLNHYLDNNYQVLASYGHVRDLKPRTGAVDPDNGFNMHYQLVERNIPHVEKVRKALGKAEVLYLATDPDREGEAIAWHLCEVLREQGALEGRDVRRVVFHEVTKQAILEAFKHARGLSLSLVDAYRARRALDYLVGFKLSPLLWKKISRGLSAGRVQSPALRMIVEREIEIENFKPREYWTIETDAVRNRERFRCRLVRYRDKPLKQFSIGADAHAQEVRTELLEQAGSQLTGTDPAQVAAVGNGKAPRGILIVSDVRKKQRRQQPAAPFTTSTLQQESVRKLKLSSQNTMRLAQQLYEGIETGAGLTGLITYMRTDSVNLATSAVREIRDYIGENYEEPFLPPKPQLYRTRTKNAQEAHEAIRPTSIRCLPGQLRAKLSQDQFRLYELIWKRTLACQMAPALIDTVTVELDCGTGNRFRATGSTVVMPGFLSVYEAERGEQAEQAEGAEGRLPALRKGDLAGIVDIQAVQHFTIPPPRYSEASLVAALEAHGIGRPSTYVSIMSTLRQRRYVEMQKKRFTPTEIGRTVSKFLAAHFEKYVDYGFTAEMEDKLDAISCGQKEWIPIMGEFWRGLEKQIQEKEQSVSRREVSQARELGTDPKSGQLVLVRMGKFGPYVQLGEGSDEEKPRFAGLLPEQGLDTITLEEALSLLELPQLPRTLGTTEQGEEVAAGRSRYGPYVRYGSQSDPRFVSIPDPDDPFSITLERALELIEERKKKEQASLIQEFDGCRVVEGRYGPYITDGKKNISVPKDKDPQKLTEKDCLEILSRARPRRGTARKKKAKR